MPALVLTNTEVLSGSDADFYQGLAGETITAGQVCYLSAATNRLLKADANLSLAAASVKGVALNGASAEQPLRLQTGGVLIFGATSTINSLAVVVGENLILDATAGGMTQAADAATGWYVTTLGVTSGADRMRLNIFSSNQPVP